MLFVGTQTNDPNRRIEIDFDGLLHHTLIVGQSGSGKSFLVARIIEEILLRSQARILMLDPNGDFRRLSQPSEDVWSQHSDTFSRLGKLTTKDKVESFDDEKAFRAGWKKRRFTYLTPVRSAPTARAEAADHRLVVHWDLLDPDQRSFLLNADPSREPKIFLGLKAVTENARWVSHNRPLVGIHLDLKGLLEVARQFTNSNIGMKEYEYAKVLQRDDWYSVQAKIDDLISKYSIWDLSDQKGEFRVPGVSDFIDGAFEGQRSKQTYWDTLVLSLESAHPQDSLLAADVALSRLWLRAKNEWRKRAERPEPEVYDSYSVPTFIVVDEAHNFAPEHNSDPLRGRVTSRLMQIASEGRKYGLYLILATQRPTKLHRELVAECENACVLRLQSKIETEFANSVLGLSAAEALGVPSFTKGQGVFIGRWVGGTAQMNTKIAPARTVLGGGDIGSNWKTVPEGTPEINLLDAISTFVSDFLSASDGPVNLATLAQQVSRRFGPDPEGRWFGHISFKGLLDKLTVDRLVVSARPPAYAYLEGHHSPLGGAVSMSAENADAGVELAAILSDCRQLLGMPVLGESELRQLFSAISAEAQGSKMGINEMSKTVRDRCAQGGFPIARRSILYVLKGIHLADHKYDDPDADQSPEVLASAYARSIVGGLEKIGYQVGESAGAKLSAYLTGRDVDLGSSLADVPPELPADELPPK